MHKDRMSIIDGKTFLITNHFSFHNKGCQALVETIVRLVRRVSKKNKIVLLSYTPNYDSTRMDLDIRPDYWKSRLKGLLGLLIGTVIFSYREFFHSSLDFLKGHESIAIYEDADIVICTGGDVFSEDYGWRGFLWHGSYIALPILLGKRVVIPGHTIGPYRSAIKKIIMKFLFDHVNLISIRDTMSAGILEEIGTHCPLLLTADTAFLLDSEDPGDELAASISVLPHPIIGLSVSMGIARFTGSDEHEYFLLMARILDYVVESLGGSVVMISHSTGPTEENDDRIACRNVVNLARQGRYVINPVGDLTAGQVKGLIGRCDFLIGSRTHATIAALSLGKPAIAIAYSMKSLAIFSHWFDQGDCVYDIRKSNFEEVTAKIEDIWNNLKYRRMKIRSRLKWVRLRAIKNEEAIAWVLEGRELDRGPGPKRTISMRESGLLSPSSSLQIGGKEL